MQRKTLIGVKFERLTPLKRIHTRGRTSNDTIYECLCDCGNTKQIRYCNLINGTTRSCGCYAKELLRKRNQKGTGKTAIATVWQYYKRNAKLRNLVWELTKDEFLNLVYKACIYCGLEKSLSVTVKYGDFSQHNGIDRTDNKIGYTLNNSVPCCNICNRAKNDMSPDDYVRWTSRFKDR